MKKRNNLTPSQIVKALDIDIVGQQDAKRAVAIALRNRWRRQQIAPGLREEIAPKNILMIGPTGVGKTEIARRLADLVKAPFIKVEATKFTEVGYVGQDVEKIVRDLVDIAVRMSREEATALIYEKASKAAKKRVLKLLLAEQKDQYEEKKGEKCSLEQMNKLKSKVQKNFNAGKYDKHMIDVELQAGIASVEIMAPPGMEEMSQQLESMFQNLNMDKFRKKKMLVPDAMKCLAEVEAEKLINEEETIANALIKVKENGIVFLDEIDKIVLQSGHSSRNSDVSREGVQRDLLPLIEGTTVSTKYGQVETDHILFIAAGAFLEVKPSDMASELQGRLPIRVELKALTAGDFRRILLEPKASLVKQYLALLAVEGIELVFSEDGVGQIADIAYHINDETVNIGARRLHTVMEKLLEEISFNADHLKTKKILINKEYVDSKLSDLVKDEDLTRWIL